MICFKANYNLGGIPTTEFSIVCNLQLAQIEKRYHHGFQILYLV
ncbi:hypothetical protein D1BOALGB6SA_10249 [Olavius sp. associated proteobacterium Delta 1]|nr:hypothetical protein D1BOALGB6SA_10249 [Olavius sp. associated proteobacterium Delta 1]